MNVFIESLRHSIALLFSATSQLPTSQPGSPNQSQPSASSPVPPPSSPPPTHLLITGSHILAAPILQALEGVLSDGLCDGACLWDFLQHSVHALADMGSPVNSAVPKVLDLSRDTACPQRQWCARVWLLLSLNTQSLHESLLSLLQFPDSDVLLAHYVRGAFVASVEGAQVFLDAVLALQKFQFRIWLPDLHLFEPAFTVSSGYFAQGKPSTRWILPPGECCIQCGRLFRVVSGRRQTCLWCGRSFCAECMNCASLLTAPPLPPPQLDGTRENGRGLRSPTLESEGGESGSRYVSPSRASTSQCCIACVKRCSLVAATTPSRSLPVYEVASLLRHDGMVDPSCREDLSYAMFPTCPGYYTTSPTPGAGPSSASVSSALTASFSAAPALLSTCTRCLAPTLDLSLCSKCGDVFCPVCMASKAEANTQNDVFGCVLAPGICVQCSDLSSEPSLQLYSMGLSATDPTSPPSSAQPSGCCAVCLEPFTALNPSRGGCPGCGQAYCMDHAPRRAPCNQDILGTGVPTVVCDDCHDRGLKGDVLKRLFLIFRSKTLSSTKTPSPTSRHSTHSLHSASSSSSSVFDMDANEIPDDASTRVLFQYPPCLPSQSRLALLGTCDMFLATVQNTFPTSTPPILTSHKTSPFHPTPALIRLSSSVLVILTHGDLCVAFGASAKLPDDILLDLARLLQDAITFYGGVYAFAEKAYPCTSAFRASVVRIGHPLQVLIAQALHGPNPLRVLLPSIAMTALTSPTAGECYVHCSQKDWLCGGIFIDNVILHSDFPSPLHAFLCAFLAPMLERPGGFPSLSHSAASPPGSPLLLVYSSPSSLSDQIVVQTTYVPHSCLERTFFSPVHVRKTVLSNAGMLSPRLEGESLSPPPPPSPSLEDGKMENNTSRSVAWTDEFVRLGLYVYTTHRISVVFLTRDVAMANERVSAIRQYAMDLNALQRQIDHPESSLGLLSPSPATPASSPITATASSATSNSLLPLPFVPLTTTASANTFFSASFSLPATHPPHSFVRNLISSDLTSMPLNYVNCVGSVDAVALHNALMVRSALLPPPPPSSSSNSKDHVGSEIVVLHRRRRPIVLAKRLRFSCFPYVKRRIFKRKKCLQKISFSPRVRFKLRVLHLEGVDYDSGLDPLSRHEGHPSSHHHHHRHHRPHYSSSVPPTPRPRTPPAEMTATTTAPGTLVEDPHPPTATRPHQRYADALSIVESLTTCAHKAMKPMV